MSPSSTHRLASPAAGVIIALLLMLALIPLMLGSAQAAVRVEASSNVQAAVEYSQLAFPTTSPAALLGRDDLFPDNLASGGAQGRLNAPLLLTDSDDLSDETATELERLGVQLVYILGGTNAVSQDVEDELVAEGYTVERLFGETRIETAIDIASNLYPAATTAIVARAFPATGGTDETQAFADSLAAGAWAADDEYPVLLTQTEMLTENTRAYLDGSTIQTVFVVGGTDAVSEQVITDLEALGITVERVSGATRFATAVAIANERGFSDSSDADTTILVEGQDTDAWASGFPAAALADFANAPVVLANGEMLPQETRDFLVEEGADTRQGTPTGTEGTEACEPGVIPIDPPIVPIPDNPIIGACPTASPGATPTGTGGPGGMPVGVCGYLVTDAACEAFDEELGIGSPGGSPSPSGSGR